MAGLISNRPGSAETDRSFQEKMLEIRLFEPQQSERWDAFVQESYNGTLFHERRFLSYHPPERFHDASLMFYRDGRLLAVLPAARRPGDAEPLLVSHPGASFGGPVMRKGASLKETDELVRALIRWAGQNGYVGIDLTLPPAVYLKAPGNYLDFCLYKQGFRYRKREMSSVVPLPAGESEVLPMFSPQARRAVRKAQKSDVLVTLSDDYAAFYRILERNLRLRHNVTPTHTLEELEMLVRLYPERIHLYAAQAEQRMIAGLVMFDATPQTTLAFYISHDQDFQQYRAVNLLFYEVFCRYVRAGYRYLDFGLFSVDMEPNWGLARFKEGFGALGVFRDSFVLKLG